jgi:hypothetical protein
VEHVGGQRHVSRLRYDEGLPVVQRLELGELVQVLQDQIADPPDDAAPLGWGHPAPRAFLERSARGLHGPVDVLGFPFGNLSEGLACRGVRRREGPARRRSRPLPADE